MKETLCAEYFGYMETYQKKYGKDKVIVLMQKGHFYEMYFYKDKGADMHEISEILSMTLTKASGKDEASEKNPHMIGFPIISLFKHLQTLLDNGFMVIQVDETGKDKKGKQVRKIIAVHTSGISVGEQITTETNNIISIYIEEEQQMKGDKIICVGMCSLDLTTSKCLAHEVISKDSEDKFSLDEVRRFISITQPKEIIINVKNNNKSNKNSDNKTTIKDKLKPFVNYLELNDRPYRYNDHLPSDIFNLKYQNKILEGIYKIKGLLTPIENVGMEKRFYCVISFVILLDFINTNNPSVLKGIQCPVFLKNDRNLILGNDAIYQLNILDNPKMESKNTIGSRNKKQFRSLFDVVNMTSTGIGKRYLRYALQNPLCKHVQIQKRYDSIEIITKKKITNDCEKYLLEISDIEKLHTKMCLGKLHPFEFKKLHESYVTIIKLIKFLKKYCDKNDDKEEKTKNLLQPDKFKISDIKEFMEKYEKVFDVNMMGNYNNLDQITNSFLKDVDEEITKLQKKIDKCRNFMSLAKKKFEKILNDNRDDTILIAYNKREGHYLILTARRAENLKKLLKRKMSDDGIDTIKINKDVEIDPKKITYKTFGKGAKTKMFFDEFGTNSDDLTLLEQKIGKKVREYYLNKTSSWYKKYNIMFKNIVEYIGCVDYIKSCAKVSAEYNYVKPTIKLKDKAYFKGQQIRHPIIERITTTEYIPHDISLGISDNMDGLLVYGTNSVGKSSLMKKVGLLITMAQAGMWVPATKFVYHPYESIYARITGNDNLFKGLSSFELEMVELRSIIKRTTQNTLVIGDEICRGTEYISGLSIVSETILLLSKLKCSFIFASHLHAVSDFDCIKKLENVKSYHMKIEKGEKNTLIYNRQLKEGPGEQIYGLLIAEHILHDRDFIEGANKIKNMILKNKSILTPKHSKYNKNVYMVECAICYSENSKNLDTHHIQEQSMCINNFAIRKPHIKKNSESNLVVLCKKCHQDVHHGTLKIMGYKKTTDGTILDWKKVNKLDEKTVKYILEMKKNYKKKHKENICTDEIYNQVKDELLKKYKINVSKINITKIFEA